jgi:hypothetical protein
MPPAPALLRKPKDFLLGLIFLGIAIWLVVHSYEYDFGTARQMGPGYLPWVLGVALSAFGVVLIGGSFFGAHEHAEPFGLHPMLLLLGGVALFALLIRPAGLIVSILATIGVSGFAYRKRRMLPLAIYGIALAVGCVLVFPLMLGQQIPILGSWFLR